MLGRPVWKCNASSVSLRARVEAPSPRARRLLGRARPLGGEVTSIRQSRQVKPNPPAVGGKFSDRDNDPSLATSRGYPDECPAIRLSTRTRVRQRVLDLRGPVTST